MEKEPRKIVLILGNGFDLDLGLKTSYKDFWESEFCPKDYPAPLINHLNERWGEDLEAVRWYDLENELMNYYRKVSAPGLKVDVFSREEEQFIRDVNPALISFGIDDKYINAANSLFQKGYLVENPRIAPRYLMPYREDMLKPFVWRDRKALGLIKDGLCKYLRSIYGQELNNKSVALSVLYAVDTSRLSGDNLNIYTFNYTQLPVDYSYGFKDTVHYVHGSCETEKIIVGTRDDPSIDNNYDFLQKSFDPHFNPPSLVADLFEADEVIIFGHSIGENDRQYFKSFFKQQTDYSHPKRKDIIIFTLNDASEVQIKRSLQHMTDGNLSTLYGLNRFQIIKTANMSENRNLFSDFLVDHHIDRLRAEAIIDKLLQ